MGLNSVADARDETTAFDRPGQVIESRRFAIRLLFAIILLGALLRLVGIDWQSLWLDEVSSLRNARAFATGGFQALASVDQIAPLHSVALWLSTSLLGESEFGIRLPSALAGIATIPLVYVAAMRMFASRGVALAAAAIVSVSPFAIWYSQEGRMYALLLLASTAYVALVWPIVERPLKWQELLLLTIITALGLGMHHYMALLSMSFGIFLLVKDRGLTARSFVWGLTQVVAAVIFSSWIYLTLHTMGNAAGNEKPAILFWAPYTFYSFVVGQTYGPAIDELALAREHLLDVVIHSAPAVLAAAFTTGVIGMMGIRHARRHLSHIALLWLFLWLFLPIGLAIFATLVTNIQFNVRYVVMSFPALAIFLALGIGAMRWATLRDRLRGVPGAVLRRRDILGFAAVAALGAIILSATVNLYADPRYERADVRSLARYLATKPERAVLVADNNRVSKVLGYYHGTVPAPSLGVDYNVPAKSPEGIWENVSAVPRRAGDEFWLIEYRSWESDPQHFLRTQFERNGQLLGVDRWPGVTVHRYRMNPAPVVAASPRA